MGLLTVTQDLLRTTPRFLSLKQISIEAGVPYRWLTDFATDRINDPGVRKVQAVHDYLVRVPHERPMIFSWEEAQRKILPEIPGLYELFDKHGVMLYIGETKSLSRRIGEHMRSQVVIDAEPHKIRFTEMHDRDERLWIEGLRIRSYNPILNITHNQQREGYATYGRARTR